jgi:hypothetical protein
MHLVKEKPKGLGTLRRMQTGLTMHSVRATLKMRMKG